MIQTVEGIDELFLGTPLDGRVVDEWWSPHSRDSLFVVDVDEAHMYEEVAALRALSERSGRYAVLSTSEHVESQFFDESPSDVDFDGDGLTNKTLAEALCTDGAARLLLGGLANQSSPTRTTDLFGWLDVPLNHPSHLFAQMTQRFGNAPTVKQVRDLQSAGVLKTDADLERWLFEWELAHFGDAALSPPSLKYLDDFEFPCQGSCVAVLLPTLQPAKALLEMGWYGLQSQAVAKAAAMQVWHEKFGAELQGSFVTSLHMQVRRRPQSVNEALDLAIEHCHFAPDTLLLPNVSLRDHARALLSIDRWFFLAQP